MGLIGISNTTLNGIDDRREARGVQSQAEELAADAFDQEVVGRAVVGLGAGVEGQDQGVVAGEGLDVLVGHRLQARLGERPVVGVQGVDLPGAAAVAKPDEPRC